jgi:hypothetical protein
MVKVTVFLRHDHPKVVDIFNSVPSVCQPRLLRPARALFYPVYPVRIPPEHAISTVKAHYDSHKMNCQEELVLICRF